MQPDTVSFRNHEGADVCEIQLQGGNVGVFPANEVIGGSVPPTTYAELYREAFEAYKRGEVKPRSDAERIAELEAQVASLSAANAVLDQAASKSVRKKAQLAGSPRNSLTAAEVKERFADADASLKTKAKPKAKAPAKKAAKKAARKQARGKAKK